MSLAKQLDSRARDSRYCCPDRLEAARNAGGLFVGEEMSLTVTQNNEEITFRLSGSERDKGFVRLEQLAECIEYIQECLHETERCVSGKRGSLTYVIKSLTVGSPAIGVIEAQKPRRRPDNRREVASVTRRTIASLAQGERKLDPRLDHDAFKSFRKFASLVLKSDDRAKCELIFDGTVITPQFFAAVDRALEIEEVARGSVSGLLEKIDVHGKNQFAIFPPIGTHQVTCAFADELLPKVQSALKKTVTVYGQLHYVADRFLPTRVDVDDLEAHPPADDLPRLSDMAGKLIGVEGDSVQIVRDVRNDWD